MHWETIIAAGVGALIGGLPSAAVLAYRAGRLSQSVDDLREDIRDLNANGCLHRRECEGAD